jgi:hypothetical protein
MAALRENQTRDAFSGDSKKTARGRIAVEPSFVITGKPRYSITPPSTTTPQGL